MDTIPTAGDILKDRRRQVIPVLAALALPLPQVHLAVQPGRAVPGQLLDARAQAKDIAHRGCGATVTGLLRRAVAVRASGRGGPLGEVLHGEIEVSELASGEVGGGMEVQQYILQLHVPMHDDMRLLVEPGEGPRTSAPGSASGRIPGRAGPVARAALGGTSSPRRCSRTLGRQSGGEGAGGGS